jgi:hypothetical protein
MMTELPRRSGAGQRKAIKRKIVDAFFWGCALPQAGG